MMWPRLCCQRPQVEAETAVNVAIRPNATHHCRAHDAELSEIPHITFTISADMTATSNCASASMHTPNGMAQPRFRSQPVLAKVCGGRCSVILWSTRRARNGIEMHDTANIGVAVALEDGLIVPVVHDAGRKELSAIAARVNELTEKRVSADCNRPRCRVARLRSATWACSVSTSSRRSSTRAAERHSGGRTHEKPKRW